MHLNPGSVKKFVSVTGTDLQSDCGKSAEVLCPEHFLELQHWLDVIILLNFPFVSFHTECESSKFSIFFLNYGKSATYHNDFFEPFLHTFPKTFRRTLSGTFFADRVQSFRWFDICIGQIRPFSCCLSFCKISSSCSEDKRRKSKTFFSCWTGGRSLLLLGRIWARSFLRIPGSFPVRMCDRFPIARLQLVRQKTLLSPARDEQHLG